MSKIKTILMLMLLIVALGIQSCKKDKNDDGGNAQIPFEKQDYYAFELAQLNVLNTNLADGEYEGSIDGTTHTLFATNGSLVTLIPEIAAGAHQLAVTINGKAFTASFNVLASPAFADPNTIFNHFAQASNSTLQNLTQYADSLVPNEKSQLLSEIQTMQQFQDSVYQLYNALSPQQKEDCARFLAANQWWLDDLHLAVNRMLTNSLAFKTQDAVKNYEAGVIQSIEAYIVDNAKVLTMFAKLVGLTGVGALIGGAPSLGVGIPLGATVGGLLGLAWAYKDFKALDESIGMLLKKAIKPFQDMFTSGKTNSIVAFNNNASKLVTVRMNYRSVYAADASTSVPLINSFVKGLQDLKAAWNSAATYLPLSSIFTFKTADEIQTYLTETREVNSQYLTVSNISNPKVTLVDVDKFDGYLKLKFKTDETTKQSFSLKVNYNSELGQNSSTVDAELEPQSDRQWYKGYYTLGHWGDSPASNVVYNCGSQYGQSGEIYICIIDTSKSYQMVTYCKSIISGMPNIYEHGRGLRLLEPITILPYRHFDIGSLKFSNDQTTIFNGDGATYIQIPEGTGSSECDGRYSFFYKILNVSLSAVGKNPPSSLSAQELERIEFLLGNKSVSQIIVE